MDFRSINNQILGTGAVRISGAFLSFLLTATVARLLGPQEYGIYTFVITIVTFIALPSQLGLPTLLVREIAGYEVEGNWSLIKGIAARSYQIILITSVSLGVIAATVVSVFNLVEVEELEVYYLSFLLLPIIGLNNARSAILRGFRKVVIGLVPDSIIKPAGILIIIAFIMVFQEKAISAKDIMVANIAATLMALLAGTIFIAKLLPPYGAHNAEYKSRYWVSTLIPLTLISGIQIINGQVDILLLGLISSKESVALYKVAVLISTQIAIFISFINMAFGPEISRLHKRKEKHKLQALAYHTSKLILLLTIPAFIIITFSGQWILSVIFGPAYVESYAALLILCAAQLVGAVVGSVALICNMTGNEKSTLLISAMAAVVNVVLNLILIPKAGIDGAAIASLVSYSFWNIALAFVLYGKESIQSSIFIKWLGKKD